MEEDNNYVSHIESEIRWDSHDKMQGIILKNFEDDLNDLKKIIEQTVSSHYDVHTIHSQAHEREHQMTNLAITKAEESMDRRLDSMTQFREELSRQTQSFLTKEAFEKYTGDFDAKMDVALNSILDKSDTQNKALINRHDSDYNNLREIIQGEKEIRKSLEGSINTWKWLAGFLGLSGVTGVVLLFATRVT